MFYQVKNLSTSITLPAWEMHAIGNDSLIIKKIKEKMEGRCRTDLGYIIRVLDEDANIYEAVVGDQGSCKVNVKFSVIAFLPSRDQTIEFMVTDLCHEWIKGALGPMKVFISENNIGFNWQYNKEEGCFIEKSTKDRIERDSRIRCKVLSVHTPFHNQIKVIGSLIECSGLGAIIE